MNVTKVPFLFCIILLSVKTCSVQHPTFQNWEECDWKNGVIRTLRSCVICIMTGVGVPTPMILQIIYYVFTRAWFNSWYKFSITIINMKFRQINILVYKYTVYIFLLFPFALDNENIALKWIYSIYTATRGGSKIFGWGGGGGGIFFFKGMGSGGRLKGPCGSRATPWWGPMGRSPRKLLNLTI